MPKSNESLSLKKSIKLQWIRIQIIRSVHSRKYNELDNKTINCCTKIFI